MNEWKWFSDEWINEWKWLKMISDDEWMNKWVKENESDSVMNE